MGIAGNPNVSDALLEQLMKKSPKSVAFGSNKPELLEALSSNPDRITRMGVGMNHSAPCSALERLISDSELKKEVNFEYIESNYHKKCAVH